MRIVQTFWSAGGDLLKNSYSWLEPQYHLMSWALSCLSLRENYNEVVLYTDSNGYKVLIEQLQLPYTDVIIQYDDLKCPKHQWAYSKILSYSLQKKPFLHIDGDVYLPNRLNPELEQGGIIAQNKEKGTAYYRNMVNKIQDENIMFPEFLEKELHKESIPSYNAGVLGGNDIEFIQDYCQAVFDYVESNQLLHKHLNYSSHNILFEQILFHALASEKNKKVTTILKQEINDNGYSHLDFCDFYSYKNYTLMHIIGGHKKRKQTCELLSRTLLKKYPEYYQRIIKLFPEKHKRFQHQKKKETYPISYSEYAYKLQRKWRKIPNHILFDLERKSSDYLEYAKWTDEKRQSVIIKRNPYLSIYEKRNTEELIQSDIALIPSLLNNGFQEVLIDDLSYNILITLKYANSIESIQKKIYPYFRSRIAKDYKVIEKQIKEKLEYLLYNKLIYTTSI